MVTSHKNNFLIGEKYEQTVHMYDFRMNKKIDDYERENGNLLDFYFDSQKIICSNTRNEISVTDRSNKRNFKHRMSGYPYRVHVLDNILVNIAALKVEFSKF